MDTNNFNPVDWQPQTFSRTTQGRRFDCNTLIMVNQGTQNVTIDGNLTLTPGQGFTFECYPGEINIHPYDIVFVNDQLNGCRLVTYSKLYTKK